MSDYVPAPAGWYFVRVWDGEGHVMGLQRFPVALWKLGKEGDRATALVVKPGEPEPVALSEDDRLAAVGFCPPDREWQTYFSSGDVQRATERWYRGDPRGRSDAASWEAKAGPADDRATVREVEMPGVGKIPVRDARPPGQTGTSEWMRRAWGEGAVPRLGGGGPK